MARYQQLRVAATSDTFHGRWHFRRRLMYGAAAGGPFAHGARPQGALQQHLQQLRQLSYELGKRSGLEQSLNWRISERQQLQAGLGWQNTTRWWRVMSRPRPYRPILAAHGQGQLLPQHPTLPADTTTTGFNLSAYAQLQSQWETAFSTSAGLRSGPPQPFGGSFNRAWAPLPNRWRSVAISKLQYGGRRFALSPEESLSAYGTFSGAWTRRATTSAATSAFPTSTCSRRRRHAGSAV